MANSPRKSTRGAGGKSTSKGTRARNTAGSKAKAASKAASKAAPKTASPAPEAEADAAAQAEASGGGLGGGMRMGENENYLDFLSRVFQDMGANQWDTQKFDDMTQGMSLVLGSGPAFAALESMLANTTAQSAVLMNAAQTQRQLDQVGLCCTSACVKQLLNMNNSQDSD